MNAEPADSAVTAVPKATKRARKPAVRPSPAADTASAAATANEAVADTVLKLDADLGIDHTASLRAQLASRIDDAAPVIFDGSEVQRVHTATLQLFLMFCQSRYAAGRQTAWHNPSPSLQAAAKVLGLAPSLQLARDPS